MVKFCSDDPDAFLKAARFIENDCDAIDLNLGCPQNIAKRGHYGAFLQDEWELVAKIREWSTAPDWRSLSVLTAVSAAPSLQRRRQSQDTGHGQDTRLRGH